MSVDAVNVMAPAASRAAASTSTAGAASAETSVMDAGLAGAVCAARAVLEEDRWRRKPNKVTLKAEEEVGLAALLRCGTGELDRDVPGFGNLNRAACHACTLLP